MSTRKSRRGAKLEQSLLQFFNQAPSKPMLKPGLGETIGSFFRD